MNQPNVLLALSVQLLCFVSVLEAYSNGNLTEACYTMVPGHEGTTPSTDPCPYETVPSQTAIIQGESLTITLQNKTTTSFRGYMTMAFDASKPDDAGPVGTFDIPTDGQILSCPDGENNTISHRDNNSIKKFVQANWTAPVDFVGTVVFKTTFVRGESIYWVKEPSTENVVVLASASSTEASTEPTTSTATTTSTEPTTSAEPTTSTEPTTTQYPTKVPCGASSLSYSWITGFVLLFLAFSHQS